MNALVLMRDYIVWHYTTGIVDLLYIWRNFLWAVGHMFSVKDVLLTLFSPFKRLQEQTPSPLKNLEGFLSSLVVNILMRIVGLVIRSALLILAFLSWAFLLVFGVVSLVVWFLLPYLLFVIFVTAVSTAFS